MEEEDREVCKFLIVLAASCRMVRALRVGTRLKLRLRLRLEVKRRGSVVVEVGEGRLGAARMPSTGGGIVGERRRGKCGSKTGASAGVDWVRMQMSKSTGGVGVV